MTTPPKSPSSPPKSAANSSLLLSSGLTNNISNPSSKTDKPDINWAEQANRLSDIGKEKSAQINSIASSVYKQGSSVAQEAQKTLSNPEQRRKFLERYGKTLKIGAAATVIIGAIAYWGASHEASRIADQKIHSLLANSGLSSNIQYASVSATPWGSVTLHDVTFTDDYNNDIDEKLKIAKISIRNANIGKTLPSNMTINASGIECSFTNTTTCPIISPQSKNTLLSIGYTTLKGNAKLSYKFHNGNIILTSNGGLYNGFTWGLHATLSGIPEKTFKEIPDLIKNQSAFSLIQILGVVDDVAVSNVDLQIDTRDISKRLHAVPDTNIPEPDISKSHPLSPLQNWDINGGRLEIHTHSEKAIPLMRQSLFGMPFLNPAFRSPSNFIEATNAKISTE
ncbi:hypothetical protein [Neokomagataea anthophila]|uniref:DUF945 family protein n=1 Tax=Neokomagataea anthophila TaxID=2826925 RepID=A0ABS5E9M1_9PROT|nr:hypothetical protein [Neokomagataea anthophila]MBR0560606.1 hypothetical protein [Neokomagataea anthophila]